VLVGGHAPGLDDLHAGQSALPVAGRDHPGAPGSDGSPGRSGSRRILGWAIGGRARCPGACVRPARVLAAVIRSWPGRPFCCVGAAREQRGRAGADAFARARGCSTRRWTARRAWWRPCRRSWTAATARCCPGAGRAPWALRHDTIGLDTKGSRFRVVAAMFGWPASGGAQARARRPCSAARAGAHAAGGALDEGRVVGALPRGLWKVNGKEEAAELPAAVLQPVSGRESSAGVAQKLVRSSPAFASCYATTGAACPLSPAHPR
jgi:hypothetical protein